MLILSRKIDESIIINDNIEVKIISIEKGVVKIGIEAPAQIPILRQELVSAVKDSNKSASLHVDDLLLTNLYKKISKKS